MKSSSISFGDRFFYLAFGVQKGKLRWTQGLDDRTTLTRIQPHRLKALILEDLERFPDSGRVDIHRRIGGEIHSKAVVRVINSLIEEGLVIATGEKRWRVYRLSRHGQKPKE